MIPNKTEEQILYQQFKFYDLDNSGFCTLQNFIKANDRLGVVLPKFENFELIFNYFSDPETSLLNYRQFIHEIFNFKSTNENEIIHQSVKKNEISENDFINILTDKIIQRGGTFALIELVKNLQMVDFEGNKRMNIDNFIKALQRSKIFLSTNEMQTLFNENDIFENGIVKYQILINIILEQFWDDEKLNLSEQIYYLLTGNGRRNASLNVLKNYFQQILIDSLEKKFFIEFINEYKTINKVNISQTMNLKELVYFLKFYNFGQKSNNYLTELINILKDEEQKNIYKKGNNKQSGFKKLVNQQKQTEKEGTRINNYLGEGYENPKINEISSKLREKLIKFGRKTIFNFIKHFKFYDNKTNHISKYDFAKILKNFNIKLSVDDIDEIFKNYGIDKIKNIMNYELFLNDLILGYTPKHRQNGINYLYDTILERAENCQKEVDIPFLKRIYNPKNNYFKKQESENRIEFEECLELYHYSYNGFKKDKISKKEFCYFYYFISLLIPFDEDFFEMISNEWDVPMETLNNYANNDNFRDKKNKLDMLKISDKNVHRSNMSRYAQLGENINDYQHSVNDNDSNYNESEEPNKVQNIKDYDYNNYNTNPNQNIKNNSLKKNLEDFPKEEMDKALSLLTKILTKRGLRGILYLYSQFLSFCQDINKITFNDFTLVFKIQHIDLDINTLKKIFNLFSIKNNNNEEAYLDFYSFIRTYKKELNENKLKAVEEAFTIIDEKGEDRVPLDVIKMKYNAKNHPDVLNGKFTEDGKILEFLDCFNMCYEILKMDNKKNDDYYCVDFEIFANFYEYVSFIYPRDRDFQYVVSSTWN